MSPNLDGFLVERSRLDPVTFAALAVRDERSGAAVRLAPHHVAMQRAWASEERTVSIAPSEFGKSVQLAAHLAWRVGRDPSLRIGLLSATREQAVRLLRLVSIAMRGEAFARAFPSVRVERATADELSVSGRPATMKDANVLAAAFDLSSMLGARFDLAACDDVVTRESTRTAGSRDSAWQAFLAVTASRLSPGGSIHVVNTAEHSDDIPHRLGALPGWTLRRFAALDAEGAPTWPERWPLARVEARRAELGPIGFRRAMLCEPLDAASLAFPEDDLARAVAAGQTFGLVPSGAVIIGVDPAWTVGANSDESGVVMVMSDRDGTRYVTHVEALRVRHDALVERVVELARRNHATVYVESNGAGTIIADMIGRRVPCRPLTTTATSKRARVEAFGAELASGRWVFFDGGGPPRDETRRLVSELATFSFETHMGDRASALLIASDGARAHETRPKARRFNFDPSRGLY